MELRITCALCAKLVDGWRVDDNICERGWSVTVKCHGETDTCFISERDVQQAGPHQDWVNGVAFRKAQPQQHEDPEVFTMSGRQHGRTAFLTDYDTLPGDKQISFTRRVPFARPVPNDVSIRYLEPPQIDPDTQDMLDAAEQFPEILARSFGMPFTTVIESTPDLPGDLRNYQLAAYRAIIEGQDDDEIS